MFICNATAQFNQQIARSCMQSIKSKQVVLRYIDVTEKIGMATMT